MNVNLAPINNQVYFSSNTKRVASPVVQSQGLVDAEKTPSKKSKFAKYAMIALAAMASIFVAYKSGLFKKLGSSFAPEEFGGVQKKKTPIQSVVGRTLTKAEKKMHKNLKRYFDSLPTGKNPDPVEIEKILKDLGATEKEVPFHPNDKISFGRKKKFTLDGVEYTLEVHRQEFSNSDLNPVMRFYTETNKASREYLTKNGTFKTGSYYDEFTHIDTSFDGTSWMTKAKPFSAVA